MLMTLPIDFWPNDVIWVKWQNVFVIVLRFHPLLLKLQEKLEAQPQIGVVRY
jgi:hypothetical protein